VPDDDRHAKYRITEIVIILNENVDTCEDMPYRCNMTEIVNSEGHQQACFRLIF
jgi:hypothetical protein